MVGAGQTAAASRDPSSGETAIREFANGDLAPGKLRQRAGSLLNSEGLLQKVLRLTQRDQTKFVDKVDQAYPTVDPQNAKFVSALGILCSTTERLPNSNLLPEGLEKCGRIAVASGGLTDVWRGQYDGTPVAVKAFRIYNTPNLKEAKEILWKRVPMWGKLSHENIISFRGVDMTLFQLALVYDWGQKGNISQYLVSHPGTSRPPLVFDIAKGLKYLHSFDIPHGDLKAANVVIDQMGRARLTEYGLASINSDPRFAVKISRWPAPEIIDPSREGDGVFVTESKFADVFAFAMVVVEVFTDKTPFEGQPPAMVVSCIRRGERPGMPENAQDVGLTVKAWKLLEICWQQDPKGRPTMKEVVRGWRKFVEHKHNHDITDRGSKPIAGPTGITSRLRAGSSRPLTKSEAPRFRTNPEIIHPQPGPVVIQPQEQSAAPQPNTGASKRRKKLFCGLF